MSNNSFDHNLAIRTDKISTKQISWPKEDPQRMTARVRKRRKQRTYESLELLPEPFPQQ